MSQTKTQLVEGLNINTSAPADALAIDNSGRLLIGTSSSSASAAVVIQGNSADATGACQLYLQCDQTNPVTNTDLAYIRFADGNGSVFAHIQGQVDATSGSGDYPGRLVFSTTADSQSSPTERMRIDSSGNVGIGTGAASPGTYGRFAVVGAATNAGQNVSGFFYNPNAASATICIQDNASGAGAGIGSVGNDLALYNNSAGNLTERARIDSSGRLLVGTSTARSNVYVSSTAYTPIRQFESSGSTYSNGLSLLQYSSAGYAPILTLGASASNTPGTNALIANGSEIGIISFVANDGSNFRESARITSAIDGPPGANDVPGRLSFSTTADGGINPTERMRIRATGVVGTQRGLVVGSVAGGINDDALIIGGSVIASGAGTYPLKWNSSSGVVTYDTSSRLVKENIVDCPYGIAEVKQLQPRKYLRTDDQREEIGFVADELVAVLPEFVPLGPKSILTKDENDTEEIPLGVNYEKLTAVLTKALQEAMERIETLEQRLSDAGIA